MTIEELKNIRDKYEEVEAGKRGGWFDCGEYESLKQNWFDDYGMRLIKEIERLSMILR